MNAGLIQTLADKMGLEHAALLAFAEQVTTDARAEPLEALRDLVVELRRIRFEWQPELAGIVQPPCEAVIIRAEALLAGEPEPERKSFPTMEALIDEAVKRRKRDAETVSRQRANTENPDVGGVP